MNKTQTLNSFGATPSSDTSQQMSTEDLRDRAFFVLDFSTSAQSGEILRNLPIRVLQRKSFQGIPSIYIDLFECLPYSSLNYNGDFLFLCNGTDQLEGNRRWVSCRKNCRDVVVDTNGNVFPLADVVVE